VDWDGLVNTVVFKAQESTNSQPDGITLGDFEAKLAVLNRGELLEIAVVGFNRPGILSRRLTLYVSHEQVRGRKVAPRCRVCQTTPQTQAFAGNPGEQSEKP